MAESTAAVDTDELFIPLINFSHFTAPPTPNHRTQTAHSILSGFQRAGFIYLSHHPISPSTIHRVFTLSHSFFARPQPEKDALAWTTPEANRGYSSMGQEKVTNLEDRDEVGNLREAAPDLKESFEIGREGQEGMPNRWPAGVLGREGDVEFEEGMREFFLVCKGVCVQVMRAVAVGLGIDERWFDGFLGVGDNTLRLLHYPPAPSSVFQTNKSQLRAGAHTDYGGLTLLFQDERGGLQVQSPVTGRFIDAKPIPNTIVINAADLLARWTNDLVRSTVHRVVEPPSFAPTTGTTAPGAPDSQTKHENEDEKQEGKTHPARYTIAYFCNPDFDKFIDTVPGTLAEGDTKKYEGVNSGEYLVKRLEATY